MLDEGFFSMTVDHPFIQPPQNELSDENEGDMSDDDSETTDIISCPDTIEPSTLEFFLPLWKIRFLTEKAF